MRENPRLWLHQRQQLDFLLQTRTYSSSHPILFVVCNGWYADSICNLWKPSGFPFETQSSLVLSDQGFLGSSGKAFFFSTKPFTTSWENGYTYSTWAVTAGIYVKEKAITYWVMALVLQNWHWQDVSLRSIYQLWQELTWFFPVTCFPLILIHV